MGCTVNFQKDVQLEAVLGGGNGSWVYLASWDGVPVAVKVFEASARNNDSFSLAQQLQLLMCVPRLQAVCLCRP